MAETDNGAGHLVRCHRPHAYRAATGSAFRDPSCRIRYRGSPERHQCGPGRLRPRAAKRALTVTTWRWTDEIIPGERDGGGDRLGSAACGSVGGAEPCWSEGHVLLEGQSECI